MVMPVYQRCPKCHVMFLGSDAIGRPCFECEVNRLTDQLKPKLGPHLCLGCGRPENHKPCPAYGTPFYMSGIPYTEAIEYFINSFTDRTDLDISEEVFKFIKKLRDL